MDGLGVIDAAPKKGERDGDGGERNSAVYGDSATAGEIEHRRLLAVLCSGEIRSGGIARHA